MKKSSTREKAEKILLKAAKKTGEAKIAKLATRVQLDGFEKVSEDIDGMIADLKKEKAADVKMKDFCIEALHKNEVAIEMKARDIEQLSAKIAQLTAEIEELTKAIAALQAEIAEMQVQLKRAGEHGRKVAERMTHLEVKLAEVQSAGAETEESIAAAFKEVINDQEAKILQLQQQLASM